MAAAQIQYLPHAQINQQRWDACIANAGNGLIYANSWYLNHMHPGWDGIVINDYEAVMPVTWRKKWGIKYVCQPAFAQQLGLFVQHQGLWQHENACLQLLQSKFAFVEIFLNHQHAFEGTSTAMNYVLPLKDDYTQIRAGYKNDLLKNLKRTEKFNLHYQSYTDAATAMQLYENTYADRMGAKPEDYQHFFACLQYMLQQKRALMRSVHLPNGELLAVGVFAKDAHRLYNLASTTLPNGRMLEANHVLFDQLIQEFAGSGLTLDFEGSDQPGIARFYQKFGSQPQPYVFWKDNRLPAILRWLKR